MRIVWLATIALVVASGCAACGGSTNGTGSSVAPSAATPAAVAPSPIPSPTEVSLTSDEHVELDFFAGAVPHLESVFRKAQLSEAALVEGVAQQAQSDIDSAVVFIPILPT